MKKLGKRRREGGKAAASVECFSCTSIAAYRCELQCRPITQAYAYGLVRQDIYNQVYSL